MTRDVVSDRSYTLTFRDGMTVTEQADGSMQLCATVRRVGLRHAAPGFLAAIRTLATEGATADQLAALVMGDDGAAGLPRLLYYLERFERLGLLTYTLAWQGRRIATLAPAAPGSAPRPVRPAAGVRYALSRFAVLRRDSDHLVLESPLGVGRIVLHDEQAAALCHVLSAPRTMEEAGRVLPVLPADLIGPLLGLMLGIEVLSPEGCVDAPHAETLMAWSTHDLWFHMRSRLGRHDAPYGGTYRLRDVVEQPPPVKPRMEGPITPLFRPDLDALEDRDEPFTRVLEARRSFRRWGARPIRADQLGEWLYRAARIRAVSEPDVRRPHVTTSRPYPGAGARYPLELYLAVQACEGLAPGLYHYDASEHLLAELCGQTPQVEALLVQAQAMMAAPERPQVLVVVAARILRVTWKYDSVAYAAILKDLGALYQNLYLVATAMRLAPCALGGGDSELFAAAARLDPLIEPSVGEFVIGSRPDDGRAENEAELEWRTGDVT